MEQQWLKLINKQWDKLSKKRQQEIINQQWLELSRPQQQQLIINKQLRLRPEQQQWQLMEQEWRQSIEKQWLILTKPQQQELIKQQWWRLMEQVMEDQRYEIPKQQQQLMTELCDKLIKQQWPQMEQKWQELIKGQWREYQRLQQQEKPPQPQPQPQQQQGNLQKKQPRPRSGDEAAASQQQRKDKSPKGSRCSRLGHEVTPAKSSVESSRSQQVAAVAQPQPHPLPGKAAAPQPQPQKRLPLKINRSGTPAALEAARKAAAAAAAPESSRAHKVPEATGVEEEAEKKEEGEAAKHEAAKHEAAKHEAVKKDKKAKDRKTHRGKNKDQKNEPPPHTTGGNKQPHGGGTELELSNKTNHKQINLPDISNIDLQSIFNKLLNGGTKSILSTIYDNLDINNNLKTTYQSGGNTSKYYTDHVCLLYNVYRDISTLSYYYFNYELYDEISKHTIYRPDETDIYNKSINYYIQLNTLLSLKKHNKKLFIFKTKDNKDIYELLSDGSKNNIMLWIIHDCMLLSLLDKNISEYDILKNIFEHLSQSQTGGYSIPFNDIKYISDLYLDNLTDPILTNNEKYNLFISYKKQLQDDNSYDKYTTNTIFNKINTYLSKLFNRIYNYIFE